MMWCKTITIATIGDESTNDNQIWPNCFRKPKLIQSTFPIDTTWICVPRNSNLASTICNIEVAKNKWSMVQISGQERRPLKTARKSNPFQGTSKVFQLQSSIVQRHLNASHNFSLKYQLGQLNNTESVAEYETKEAQRFVQDLATFSVRSGASRLLKVLVRYHAGDEFPARARLYLVAAFNVWRPVRFGMVSIRPCYPSRRKCSVG